jgi:hypothetical protein
LGKFDKRVVEAAPRDRTLKPIEAPKAGIPPLAALAAALRWAAIYASNKGKKSRTVLSKLKSLNGRRLRQGYGGQGSVEAANGSISVVIRIAGCEISEQPPRL